MADTEDDQSHVNRIVELRNRCVAGVPASGKPPGKPHRLLDAGMVRLADALAGNDTVTFLKIPNAKIQREGFDALMSALGSCSAMVDFYLKAYATAKMDGAALCLARALEGNSTLTSLYINSSVGNEYVDALAKVLANKRDVLVNLQLPGNNFSSSSLVKIVQAVAPYQEQPLTVQSTWSAEPSWPSLQLRQTPNLCSLRILDLSMNRIDDTVAHAVAKAVVCPRNLPHIQRIDLSHNKINTPGVKALCEALTVKSVVVDIQFGPHNADAVDHRSPNLLQEAKAIDNGSSIEIFGNKYHELVAEGRAILKAQTEKASTPVVKEATAKVVVSDTKAEKRATDKSSRRLAQIKRKLKILWNPALLTCAIEELSVRAGAIFRQTTSAFKPADALSLAIQTLQVAEELAPATMQLYGFKPGIFGPHEVGATLPPLSFAHRCLTLNQQWRKRSSPPSPPVSGNVGSGYPVRSDGAKVVPVNSSTAPLPAVSAQIASPPRSTTSTGGGNSADGASSNLILLKACNRLVQRLTTTRTKSLEATALAELALCAVGAIAEGSRVLLEKHGGAGMPIESWQCCFALCSLMVLRLSTLCQHEKHPGKTTRATPPVLNTGPDSSRTIDSSIADTSPGPHADMTSAGPSPLPTNVSTFYQDLVLVMDNFRRVVTEATARKEAYGAQLDQEWQCCASLELEFSNLAKQLQAPPSEFVRHRAAVTALSSIIQQKFPLGEFLVYGSASSGFCSVGSDLDVTFFPHGRIALKVRAALSLSRDTAIETFTTSKSGTGTDNNSGIHSSAPSKAKYSIKADASKADEATKADDIIKAEDASKEHASKAGDASKADDASNADDASDAHDANNADDASKAHDAIKADDVSKADDASNLDKGDVACVIDCIAQTLDAHSDYSDVEAVHRARVPLVSCKHSPSAVDLDVSVRNHLPV